MLKPLTEEGEISVLLIEQNLGVAIDVADTVAVMVNGRIARMMSAGELAADRDLQQRLLGVRAADENEAGKAARRRDGEPDRGERIYTIRRAGDDGRNRQREQRRRYARCGLHALEPADHPGAPVAIVPCVVGSPRDG